MSRASRGFRIAGRIIKLSAFAVIFAVIALLLWRITSSGTPKSMDVLTPNDRLEEAYGEYGKELYVFSQDLKNITMAERNYGYFSVTDYYIIPEADQIQLVFRYNNSTVRHLAEDYKLEDVPDLNELLYDVTLYVQTDLTPENSEDNAGNMEGVVSYTRVHPVESLTTHERKPLYNYYRYVFDLSSVGLSLSDLLESGELLAVYADIYYNQDIDYEETPYGTLCLYDYLAKREVYRLKSGDCKAIENAEK